MRKWEEKYKEMKSGKLDKRPSELEEKFNNKTITREELKEYEKLKRIKDNISKIDNVMEYKNKLNEQLKQIKNEQDRRKKLVDLDKEAKKLESELERLNTEREVAEKKLKERDLPTDKKLEIESKLLDIKSKMDKNQENFSKNQLTMASSLKADRKISELSREQLELKKYNISSRISKCNMICARLMEGYSWDSIDIKLEKWQDKKFTSDKETSNKIRKMTEANNKEELSTKIEENHNTLNELEESDTNSKLNKEILEVPAEISEFDRKHPRFAKIKEFFKRVGYKIKDTFKIGEKYAEEYNVENEKKLKTESNKLETTKQEFSENKGNIQKENREEKLKNENEDFRKYIKVVAEKGVKEADKERLDAKKKIVQKKIVTNEGRELGDD